LIISGGETDVCVLAAVMDAVDAGYRVVLAEDALCSVSDESHDAMLRQFGARFSPTASLVLLNGLQRGPAATGAPWQDQHQRAREADAQCCDGIRHVAL
jgi:hypothetical protein